MISNISNIAVRLEPWEIKVIRTSFSENFLESDQLWLFGSRADISKRGGDIDLYIETKIPDINIWRKAQQNFYHQLIMELGDQKIDIVVNSNAKKLPIHKIAKETGVQLV